MGIQSIAHSAEAASPASSGSPLTSGDRCAIAGVPEQAHNVLAVALGPLYSVIVLGLLGVATTCIPNFPEKNLPTIFIYHEGALRKQYIGPLELRGDKLTVEELEFMLGQAGAVPTEISEDPRPQIRDKMLADLEDKSADFY